MTFLLITTTAPAAFFTLAVAIEFRGFTETSLANFFLQCSLYFRFIIIALCNGVGFICKISAVNIGLYLCFITFF